MMLVSAGLLASLRSQRLPSRLVDRHLPQKALAGFGPGVPLHLVDLRLVDQYCRWWKHTVVPLPDNAGIDRGGIDRGGGSERGNRLLQPNSAAAVVLQSLWIDSLRLAC